MLESEFFLNELDKIRVDIQKRLDRERQSEMGQFLTRSSIARMMASMFTHFPSEINLLDPGAGVGSLSATFILSAIQASPKPQNIRVTAFEVDPILIGGLKYTLDQCKQLCNQHKITLIFDIRQMDFIESSVEIISGANSLFPQAQPTYNFAIMNPPYKKITNDSRTRRLLNEVNIETTNMYSAFMWLTMKLLAPDGEMVAIVPRSFCNGPYFLPFRKELLHTMAINRIHVFESRDKAFNEGDVLQENIIIQAKKTSKSAEKTIITSNDNPEDVDVLVRETGFDQLVQPGDPYLFIRLIPDQIGHQINSRINRLPATLKELGITVSTGRVVDFRAKNLLRYVPDKEVIPLIYPGNLQNGLVQWPKPNSRKPSCLVSTTDIDNLAIPSQYYVLVKRFSSKEEKRRVYAALYDPLRIPAKRVGFENHINYFHKRYGGLSVDLAKGLTVYLNSSLVDQFFRQFSGHTQVNATDLRNLKYPSEAQLISLGRRVGNEFPDQDEIDKILEEELALNEKNDEKGIQDPLLAKKK